MDKIIRNEKENYIIYIIEEAYQYIDFNIVPDNVTVKIENEIVM
jgi:hypothetical protein